MYSLWYGKSWGGHINILSLDNTKKCEKMYIVYNYIVEPIKYSKYTINYNDKEWSNNK